MAAITKRLLHLRQTFHSHAKPSPCTKYHFSSSRDGDNSQQPRTQSSVSSSFNVVRASLRTPPPPQSGGSSRDEISSRLAEFRSRSAPPPPNPGSQFAPMQDRDEKSIKSNGESSTTPSDLGAGGRSPYSIGERMSQASGAASPVGSLSESRSFSLKNKTVPNADLTGGILNLFGKETMGKGGSGLGSSQMSYGKAHELSSLGKKLKTMRPEKRKGKWFSLQELSDRLAKVRLADQEKLERAGYPSRPINQSSQNINQDPDQKKKARNQIISLLDPRVRKQGLQKIT